jgi:hypothetical protein
MQKAYIFNLDFYYFYFYKQIGSLNKAAGYRVDCHLEEDVASSPCLGLLLAFLPNQWALGICYPSAEF